MPPAVALDPLDVPVRGPAHLAVLVLSVGEHVRPALRVELDLDHLPVALVLSEAEQVLRVVVEPHPVLEPLAALLAGHHAPVEHARVAPLALHAPGVGERLRSLPQAVVLLDGALVRVGREELERHGRVAADARDQLAVARHQQVARVLHHAGHRARPVVVLAVVAQDRLVQLEQVAVERRVDGASVPPRERGSSGGVHFRRVCSTDFVRSGGRGVKSPYERARASGVSDSRPGHRVVA